MKITCLSDVHTEFMTYDEVTVFEFPSDIDYLILNGDIGSPDDTKYLHFIALASEKYRKVFVIAGNHEYYYHTIEQTKRLINKICAKFNNVVFLDNEIYKFEDGTVLIGSTLWSQLDTSRLRYIKSNLSDFSLIHDMNIDNYLSFHARAVEFIKEEIEKAKEAVIIATHHSPTIDILADPFVSDLKSCFSSDLGFLVDNNTVKAWFYGHTHYNYNDGKLISNQVGYPGEDTGKLLFKTVELN